MDARGLVERPPPQYIGGTPLTTEDLAGYRIYLEHHGISAKECDTLVGHAMELSHQPPFRLRLRIDEEKVMIEERA
jgi:hypothetical protein